MTLTECKLCGRRVLPMTDGSCPSCHGLLAGSSEVGRSSADCHPIHQPVSLPPSRPVGVTLIGWGVLVVAALCVLFGILSGIAGARTGFFGALVGVSALAFVLSLTVGVALLFGHNWARWVVLIGTPFYVYLMIVLGGLSWWLIAVVVLYALAVVFLNTKSARRYFRPERPA